MLRTYYVDTYYGRKLGMPPTTSRVSNLAWRLGPDGRDALLARMGDGLLVTGFLGGNSNSTTGDFSLGVQGFRVRGGRLAGPVGEMNASGNHRDLWTRLAGVGNDPYRYSAMRTPVAALLGDPESRALRRRDRRAHAGQPLPGSLGLALQRGQVLEEEVGGAAQQHEPPALGGAGHEPRPPPPPARTRRRSACIAATRFGQSGRKPSARMREASPAASTPSTSGSAQPSCSAIQEPNDIPPTRSGRPGWRPESQSSAARASASSPGPPPWVPSESPTPRNWMRSEAPPASRAPFAIW